MKVNTKELRKQIASGVLPQDDLETLLEELRTLREMEVRLGHVIECFEAYMLTPAEWDKDRLFLLVHPYLSIGRPSLLLAKKRNCNCE